MIDYSTWIAETDKEYSRHCDEVTRLNAELKACQQVCKHDGVKIDNNDLYDAGESWTQCQKCGGEM